MYCVLKCQYMTTVTLFLHAQVPVMNGCSLNGLVQEGSVIVVSDPATRHKRIHINNSLKKVVIELFAGNEMRWCLFEQVCQGSKV